MYAKVQDQTVVQYPYALAQLYAEHPNTSFPTNMTAQELADFGVVTVVVTGQPSHDSITQDVTEITPVYSEERSRWEQTWQVTSATAEEIAARKAAAKASNESQAEQLLQDSDWADLTSVRNTSLTPHLVNAADFDTYRLALRVIVIDPPVTVAQWPIRPAAVWS
jgi:hypothetical protein